MLKVSSENCPTANDKMQETLFTDASVQTVLTGIQIDKSGLLPQIETESEVKGKNTVNVFLFRNNF
jgi:hypothetical protein